MQEKTVKKVIYPASILLIIVVSLGIWYQMTRPDEYTAQLAIESDAMTIVNYYYPKRIQLQNTPLEENLILPKFNTSTPLFGNIILGDSPDSLISIVLDETENKEISLLYIDKNNNEDLTDDEDVAWDETNRIYATKEVLIDVSYKNGTNSPVVPYLVRFYRYMDRLTDSIIAYRNGYRRGEITIEDSVYQVALFDDDLNGLFDEFDKGAIVIDLNKDGVLDGATDSDEYYSLKSRFNINGNTFKIKSISPSGEELTLVTTDSLIFPKAALSVESQAPSFRTLDINGDIIDFRNYKNKVVLIDFWATWCKPWEERLINLKRVYRKYHARGFEIIGLSLDYDLAHFKDYLFKNNINWPQIADGKGWDMSLIDIYKINALPKSFLVDKNGIIRYKDLHDSDLDMKVVELLNELDTE